MGKASRKNKKGIKFYFIDKRSRGNTIRTMLSLKKMQGQK